MSIFTVVLAAIGTLTGSLALGWQIHTSRQSRPRLKVSATHQWPVYGTTLGEHHFAITVTNYGGAATQVTAWGLRSPDGRNVVAMQNLPYSDQPGPIEPEGKKTFLLVADDVIRTCQTHGVKVSDMRPYVVSTTAGDILGERLPWKDDSAAVA